jgi:hypothetical protein
VSCQSILDLLSPMNPDVQVRATFARATSHSIHTELASLGDIISFPNTSRFNGRWTRENRSLVSGPVDDEANTWRL